MSLCLRGARPGQTRFGMAGRPLGCVRAGTTGRARLPRGGRMLGSVWAWSLVGVVLLVGTGGSVAARFEDPAPPAVAELPETPAAEAEKNPDVTFRKAPK